MAVPKNAITLVVEGRPEDNGDVRLEDFTERLEKVQRLLTEADRLLNGRQTVYYRISDLRHQSPATVVLEPVRLPDLLDDLDTDYAANVARTVMQGARSLEGNGDLPAMYGYAVLDAYRGASSATGTKVASVRLIVEGEGEADFGQRMTERVNEIVGHTEREIGSVTGYIDRINIHAGNRVFYLYPNYGATRVKCVFPTALKQQVLDAVGRYVTVYGTMIYQGRQAFALDMTDITEVEVHPRLEDVPDIMSLRGIVPKAEGGSSLAW